MLFDFDFSNYWIFLAVIAAVYVAVSTFTQNNVGGKGRMRGLQAEMRQLQKEMTEAGKKKDDAKLNELISRNWKLTMEIMVIQTQLFALLLIVLFALMQFFPLVEPGTADDVRLRLYDDGLAEHCDAAALDGTYSGCLSLPQNGTRGAWVIDGFLLSATNETLSRNATAIYYEGGKPEDVWLQASTQSGLVEGLMGKVPHYLSVSTDKQNYTAGETVSLAARAVPSVPEGGSIEASADSGTFFHVDLPFPLPLINIRRIIGSYGAFLFFAFLIGMGYSIGKSLYGSVRKK